MTLTDGEGRQRILDAAIIGFAERGYAGTTTAAIARAAKVTQPLVHHHFKSKDGLWRAAMDQVFGDVPEVVPDDPALTPDRSCSMPSSGSCCSPRVEQYLN